MIPAQNGSSSINISSPRFETLAAGYGLVEGPRVDAEDCLYFSDALNGGVYCRRSSGEIETVIPKRRGVGGIVLHADGGIVVSGKTICHVRNGVSRVVFDIEDAPGFNDLVTDANGCIWVGTQRYNPFAPGVRPVPGEAYRIKGEHDGELLYGDVGLTNGIGFSADGRRVYHSDTLRLHIIVHDVVDGACVNRGVFAKTPIGAPDGLAVDENGCIWVASYGGGCVVRFTPDGRVDGQLAVPAKDVASVSFGGTDRRDLYVTTADNTEDPPLGGTIFRTRVEVPGLPVPAGRI
jgi:gluconolactonase